MLCKDFYHVLALKTLSFRVPKALLPEPPGLLCLPPQFTLVLPLVEPQNMKFTSIKL